MNYNDCVWNSEVYNQFEITSADRATTQGLPYDIESVMHYDARSYSINGQPTMVSLVSTPITPCYYREYPTKYDYLHINLLYCKGTYGMNE